MFLRINQTQFFPFINLPWVSTEDSSIREGIIKFDVRFIALVPETEELVKLIINLEAQNDFHPGYPLIKRGIYYTSRMISSQYGTEFTGSGYGKISKVYSIWICPDPPVERKNTINRYTIQEECMVGSFQETHEYYDLMTVIMVCLGDQQGENYSGILKLLKVLLTNEFTEQQKKKILTDDFQIKMSKRLEREVNQMCNLSQGIKNQGIELGIKQGIEQGAWGNAVKGSKNLIGLGLSFEDIAKAMELPLSVVQDIAAGKEVFYDM